MGTLFYMQNYRHFSEYFVQLPELMKFVWGIGVGLFLLVFFGVIYLKITRTYLRNKEKKTKLLQKEYENLVLSFLFSDKIEDNKEQNEIITRLKFCAKSSFKRKIIVNVLLNLHKEISGEMADYIKKLYIQSGLVDYAIKDLKSGNWFIVAKSIKELSQFKIESAQNKVQKYLFHKKRRVRKEARLYLVKLFYFDGLDFLSRMRNELSEWDQIQLLETLKSDQNQTPPNISQWLKLENISVVLFALKLAKSYNIFDAKDDILALLNEENDEVKIKAIEVLSDWHVAEIKTFFIPDFQKFNKSVQIAFMKHATHFFNEQDVDFLLQQANHPSFEIKRSALKNLKIINEDLFNSLQYISKNPEYTKVHKFIADN